MDHQTDHSAERDRTWRRCIEDGVDLLIDLMGVAILPAFAVLGIVGMAVASR